MIPRLLLAVGLAAAPMAEAGPPAPASDAARLDRSALAMPWLAAGDRPELLLAQRSIEREWTVPGDSGVVRIPGADAELRAAMLSAAIPGAGQLVEGERRGLWFLLAEAVGWAGWRWFDRDADRLRDDARALVGSPEDSASAWSFERFADATQQDPGGLITLYGADREAFYDLIAADSRYTAGWADDGSRTRFGDLRSRSDRRFSQARSAEVGLWINHLVAAVDALRAARLRHLELRRGLDLKTRGGLRHGRPELVVAIERRF